MQQPRIKTFKKFQKSVTFRSILSSYECKQKQGKTPEQKRKKERKMKNRTLNTLKITAVIIALCGVLGLCACGGSGSKDIDELTLEEFEELFE